MYWGVCEGGSVGGCEGGGAWVLGAVKETQTE